MNEQYLSILNEIDFNKVIDHPNILIAAAFWDDDRYRAARTCYRYMRAIDDLIDCHKSAHLSINSDEKQQFRETVRAWIGQVYNTSADSPENRELADTILHFSIPLWPLEAFAESMMFDIDNCGFRTLDEFIRYSQGASVAPASIFVHLSGLTRNRGGFNPPAFDVRSAATPCAMFSYLVHIIRDFQKDQRNNLNCFAGDIMARHGLTPDDLFAMAGRGPVSQNFRDMIREYMELADRYRLQTYQVIRDISPLLESRYRLSLNIIFNLYLMVFERIDTIHGRFTMEELNPAPDEIRERVKETIINFRE